MKKTSAVQTFRNKIFKEHKLTIGLDLGDRWSFYCVLDEGGDSPAFSWQELVPFARADCW